MKNYKPDPRGLAALGKPGGILQPMINNAARRGADFANRENPAGAYQVRQTPIPSGYNNELRAGALIEETGKSGAQKRVLARTINEVERG